MKKTNRIPFIILIFIHTGLLTYTFYKNKDRKRLFVLLMSNVGLAYLFDYIIVILFKAYQYKPNFLKNKYLDNLFGAILSQAIYIPFTSVFITAFQYGWKIKLFFVAYFSAIEKLFIKMGIFKTYWWKPVYSTLLLPFYFIISNFWYKHLKRGTSSFLYMSLFNALVVVCSNFFYVIALLRKVRFGLGSFHSWREHFILETLYTVICSIITTLSLKQENRFPDIKVLSFFMMTDWILKKSGIVKINFSLGYLNMLYHLFSYIMGSYFKKLLFSLEKSKQV